MLKKWEYWVVTSLAVLWLVLVVLNVTLGQGNRALQNEFSQQQQFVQQSAQLQGLNNEIIRALAELSHRNQDAAVRCWPPTG